LGIDSKKKETGDRVGREAEKKTRIEEGSVFRGKKKRTNPTGLKTKHQSLGGRVA